MNHSCFRNEPRNLCDTGSCTRGIPYSDWVKGRAFPVCGAEMRKHTCPPWWYQSADYKRKPKWKECAGVGMFTSCDSFKDKVKCWEQFDREKL